MTDTKPQDVKQQDVKQQEGIRQTVKRSIAIIVGMGIFVVALVPLYDLFCEVTGLNGKPSGEVYTYDPATTQPDRSRLVKVNFITNTHGSMSWDFWPEKGGVRVHPGQLKEVSFYVKNTTDKVMVGQAIPSLVPATAAKYFHKTECFCFNQQILQPGEELVMPMRFIVGRELPKNVQSINLSYALFDVTANMSDVATTSGY